MGKHLHLDDIIELLRRTKAEAVGLTHLSRRTHMGSARKQIEEMAGKKVFLETFVKVQPNWREDPEFLQATDWHTTSGV